MDDNINLLDQVNCLIVNQNVCQSCLSRDRKMFPLELLQEVINDLNICDLQNNIGSICWECKALITKYHKFTQQVCLAQNILAHVMLKTSQGFSSLTTNTIVSYHCVQCENDQIDSANEMTTGKEVSLEYGSNSNYVTVNDNTKPYNIVYEVQNDLKPNVVTYDNNIVIYYEDNIPQVKTAKKPNKEIAEICGKVNINIDVITIEMPEVLKRREEKREGPFYKNAPFKCETCIVGFMEEEDFEVHNSKCHDDRTGEFKCQICERIYATEKEAREHERTHYVYYKCSNCGFENNELSSVKRHVVIVHPDLADTPIYYCGLCEKSFRCKKTLRYHKRKYHDPAGFSCNTCDYKCPDAFQLKRHELTHGGIPYLKCQVCFKTYKGVAGLKLHMEIHSKKVDETAYCRECCIQFKSMSVLRRHLNTTLKHVSKENFKYKCEYCDKSFALREYLTQHVKVIHMNAHDHECKTCNKKFKSRHRAYLHQLRVHKGIERPKFTCDECGTTFLEKLSLHQHMKAHENSRPFACDICGDRFSQSDDLLTHRNVKHKIPIYKKYETAVS